MLEPPWWTPQRPGRNIDLLWRSILDVLLQSKGMQAYYSFSLSQSCFTNFEFNSHPVAPSLREHMVPSQDMVALHMVALQNIVASHRLI